MDEEIILISQPINNDKLKDIASKRFGDLVKAVVDIEKGINGCRRRNACR